eukprot:gene18041-13996_t
MMSGAAPRPSAGVGALADSLHKAALLRTPPGARRRTHPSGPNPSPPACGAGGNARAAQRRAAADRCVNDEVATRRPPSARKPPAASPPPCPPRSGPATPDQRHADPKAPGRGSAAPRREGPPRKKGEPPLADFDVGPVRGEGKYG